MAIIYPTITGLNVDQDVGWDAVHDASLALWALKPLLETAFFESGSYGRFGIIRACARFDTSAIATVADARLVIVPGGDTNLAHTEVGAFRCSFLTPVTELANYAKVKVGASGTTPLGFFNAAAELDITSLWEASATFDFGFATIYDYNDTPPALTEEWYYNLAQVDVGNAYLLYQAGSPNPQRRSALLIAKAPLGS